VDSANQLLASNSPMKNISKASQNYPYIESSITPKDAGTKIKLKSL
jgi:hypothetical protein